MPTAQAPREVERRPDEIERIARSLYENFNTRNVDRNEAVIAEDCELIDVPTNVVFRGPNGYRQFEEGWLRAFPDGKIEVLNVISNGELVVTEFIGRGTHNGPLATPAGTVKPSGRHVELRCMELLHFRDGKVARGRFFYDALTLLAQVGAISTA